MPLAKDILTQGLISLMDETMNKTEPDISGYASKMADLIDAFVKSGTVTVATGIPVATAGGPTAQTGATTSTGIGTIS